MSTDRALLTSDPALMVRFPVLDAATNDHRARPVEPLALDDCLLEWLTKK